MKIDTKVLGLLLTFFVLVACNHLTPQFESSSPSIQVIVTPTEISDEEAIRTALATYLDANADELTVVIEQNTGTHARGGMDNGYFLAAKVDGQWQIVADGQAMPDCQVVANHNFPSSMVPECQGSSGEVNAIKEALAKHLGVNLSERTVIIEEYTDTHARGGVENGYFLATKVNGQWQIVADGQAMPDCQAMVQYEFPLWMVSECSNTNFPSDEEAIRAALAAHLGGNANELTVVIEQNTGTHAKGGVDNGYFLAVKANGQWLIVADGQAMPNCNAVTQYGFPTSMVPECSSGGSHTPNCPGTGVLAAAFIGDVTYPDGSLVSPGQSFVKTWRVKNVGTCTWNGDYQLVFDHGDVMRGPASQRLTSLSIPPGKTLDISINLTAPQNAGRYRGNWRFRAPNGVIFGLSTGNPIWAEVEVENPGNSIRAALAAHLGVNPNDLTVVIDQNTGTHARGGVDNGYFLAAKVNGQWLIVVDGQAMPDCTRVAQYGFPPAMVPECQGANVLNEIHFKPGGTFAYVQKSIRGGEQHVYKIRAMANQTMIVSVSSDQNDVFVGINGTEGGQQLLSTSDHTPYWTGSLPQTQDYALTLTTNNPDTKYFLNVEIPANIRFEPGTDSTVVDGRIEILDTYPSVMIDNHVTYLIYASAGQTLDVQLSSPNLDALSMGVYGQTDGQPYLRYQVKNSGYHGVLPLTQGYYLKVFSNGASTDFTLKITIN